MFLDIKREIIFKIPTKIGRFFLWNWSRANLWSVYAAGQVDQAEVVVRIMVLLLCKFN